MSFLFFRPLEPFLDPSQTSIPDLDSVQIRPTRRAEILFFVPPSNLIPKCTLSIPGERNRRLGFSPAATFSRILFNLSLCAFVAPIMALLDFPRIEDLEQAIRQGAAEIMAKPMHLEDLFKRLAALLDTEQTGKIARRNG